MIEPNEPLSRDDRLLLMAMLSAPGIGNQRTLRLLHLFKTPAQVVSAPAGEIASALRVPIEAGRALIRVCRDLSPFVKAWERLESLGARVVTYFDEDYPGRLRDIPDPPVVLYALGVPSPLYAYSVSVVGTRAASDQGARTAARIARDLAAQGVCVVSGMAVGIDQAAHEGALTAGGKTIAVLGSGLDVIYPPSNRKLFQRIVTQGMVCTEYLPGTKPEPHNFPRRNRIISGLSLGTVIVEAGAKSGALLTAKAALEQGRELFAVPGAAGMLRSRGTNQLIKDGTAHMVESAAEIVEHLKCQLAPVLNLAAAITVPQLEGAEARIYNILEGGPLLVDDVIRLSGLSAVEVNRLITTMQLKSLLKRLPGARIGRA